MEKNKQKSLYESSQRMLISVLCANSERFSRVLEIISSEDIEEPNFAIIFNCILNLNRKNEKISLISIASELEDSGNLNKIGGIQELYRLKELGEKYLLQGTPELYAKMVKKFSMKKRVYRSIEEQKDELKEDSGVPVGDAITNIVSTLNGELYKLSDDNTVSNISKDIDEYFDLLEERKKINEENAQFADGLQGIPSSIPSINKYTTGWLPGQLITIGARTGIGKSVFAINSAVAAARSGKSVMFFSLEMGIEEIQDRIISSITNIPMNKLKQGNLNEKEQEVLESEKSEIVKWKMLIDVNPKVTVDSIRAKAIKRAQSDAKLDFIIIDYLTLITSTGHFSSRQETIADISRNMKLLAKQLQVPIMVLAQVNRAKDSEEEEKPPSLDNIRESGAIAQDSDIVILLDRKNNNEESIPPTFIILAKNRNGEANKRIRCHSELNLSRFTEAEKFKDTQDKRITNEEQNEFFDEFNIDENDVDTEEYDDEDLLNDDIDNFEVN